MDKKWPIGTKIRFIHRTLDTGKIGKIVAYHGGNPTVYLPTAEKHIKYNRCSIYKGVKITWHCGWDDIEILAVKNQQLLFDFAYER